jgi:hypothetical protein
VEAAGIEQPQENSGNTAITHESGAQSGALGARVAPLDADLAAVVDAWPTLPEAIRDCMLSMIRAAR